MPRAVAVPRTAASTCASSNGTRRRERVHERRDVAGEVGRRPGASRPLLPRTARRPPRADDLARRSRSVVSLAGAAAPAAARMRPCPGPVASRRARLSSNNGRTIAMRSAPGIRAMYCPFIQSSFSVLNTALPPLMPSSAKLPISSARRHQLAIVARRPAEQRQEVHHRLGQIPLTLILGDRRRAMPFAQALLVAAENQRHVRESSGPARRAPGTAARASACSRCDRHRESHP